MMAQTTWKWVAVAVVCSSAIGAGAVLALAPGGEMPLAPPTAEGAPTPRNPGTPAPAPEPAPPAKDNADEGWLPNPDGKVREPKDKSGDKQHPTAFPELALPVQSTDEPTSEKYEAEIDKLCSRLIGKNKLVIEPTDDTLRKLLKARLAEGVSEIRRIRDRMRIGAWSPDSRLELFECLTDMQATVMELWGGQPKELIPWLEELVIMAKYMERFSFLRVEIGTDPPNVLEAARRHRFKVEAALWRAKKRA